MASNDGFQEIVEAFRSEAFELMQGIGEASLKLEKSTQAEERHQAATNAFRCAHNIKGAASSLGLGRVEKLVHALEDVLAAIRDGEIEPRSDTIDRILSAIDVINDAVAVVQPGTDELEENDQATIDLLKQVLVQETSSASHKPRVESTPITQAQKPPNRVKQPIEETTPVPDEPPPADFVRVSQQKLDTLLAQLGELVEMKIKMEETLRRVREVDEELGLVERPDLKLPRKPLQQLGRGMDQDIQYLDKLLGEIQDELKELRMVPIKSMFPVLRRAVRDVGRKRGLKVDLTLEGGDYELDRKVVEEVKSPLVHLMRNAVGHGIEKPAERQALGKPSSGQVALRVSHQGNSICIQVSDDGRGIDYQQITERAAKLGWYEKSAGKPSPDELLRLLFASGMSTSATTDTISGRGVGLSVVQKTVENLRGTILVESEQGQGTTFKVTLPLTLATDTGLFLVTGGVRFVVPRTAVQRAVAFEAKDVSVNKDVANLWYDQKHIPLARLEPTLQLSRFSPEKNGPKHLAVILSSAEATAAIVVDEIEDEAEIVVRDLGSFIQRLHNVSGLTITASGDMYFVLNPSDLVRRVVKPLRAAVDPDMGQPGQGLSSPESQGMVILVVDDSVTSRMLNQKLLSGSGFQVITANDGWQALETLHSRRCDLVLSDVQMPHMDGYELTRQIKQDPQLNQLPVVLLTALDRPEDKERGIEAGADAYLLKPELSQAELVATIEQLI